MSLFVSAHIIRGIVRAAPCVWNTTSVWPYMGWDLGMGICVGFIQQRTKPFLLINYSLSLPLSQPLQKKIIVHYYFIN